jgi:hypothetical protein
MLCRRESSAISNFPTYFFFSLCSFFSFFFFFFFFPFLFLQQIRASRNLRRNWILPDFEFPPLSYFALSHFRPLTPLSNEWISNTKLIIKNVEFTHRNHLAGSVLQPDVQAAWEVFICRAHGEWGPGGYLNQINLNL